MTQLNIEHQRLSPLLKDLLFGATPARNNCLVVGDSCFDVTHVVETSSRLNPEDPSVPLLVETSCEESLGMMFNYVNALRKTFSREDDVMHFDTIPTIEKHRYFLKEANTYLSRVDVEPKQQRLKVPANLEPFDFLVIADYAKGAVTPSLVAELAKKSSGHRYVDTKRLDPSMFVDCTVKMNNEEFERTRPYHKCFYRIIHTKGQHGCEIIHPYNYRANYSLPGSGVAAVNVSGAGDVFFATFIGAEQYLGLEEPEALLLATVAAGISIQHTTVYIPTLEEILNVVRSKAKSA